MHNAILLLERLAALIHQAVREEAARHRLLPVHMQILAYLAQANRYSDLPIAIAQYLGITRGTVSQSLAVLARRGLIVKEKDARHGRRVHLRLTPMGEKLLAGGWASRLAQAMDVAGVAEDALTDALRGLLTGLQRLSGQRAFGVCRQCAHFLPEAGGWRCGLTGEPLEADQTRRICRDWTAPPAQH